MPSAPVTSGHRSTNAVPVRSHTPRRRWFISASVGIAHARSTGKNVRANISSSAVGGCSECKQSCEPVRLQERADRARAARDTATRSSRRLKVQGVRRGRRAVRRELRRQRDFASPYLLQKMQPVEDAAEQQDRRISPDAAGDVFHEVERRRSGALVSGPAARAVGHEQVLAHQPGEQILIDPAVRVAHVERRQAGREHRAAQIRRVDPGIANTRSRKISVLLSPAK